MTQDAWKFIAPFTVTFSDTDPVVRMLSLPSLDGGRAIEYKLRIRNNGEASVWLAPYYQASNGTPISLETAQNYLLEIPAGEILETDALDLSPRTIQGGMALFRVEPGSAEPAHTCTVAPYYRIR